METKVFKLIRNKANIVVEVLENRNVISGKLTRCSIYVENADELFRIWNGFKFSKLESICMMPILLDFQTCSWIVKILFRSCICILNCLIIWFVEHWLYLRLFMLAKYFFQLQGNYGNVTYEDYEDVVSKRTTLLLSDSCLSFCFSTFVFFKWCSFMPNNILNQFLLFVRFWQTSYIEGS